MEDIGPTLRADHVPGEGEGRLVRVLIRGPKCRLKVGRLPGTVDGVINPSDFWLLELVEERGHGVGISCSLQL